MFQEPVTTTKALTALAFLVSGFVIGLFGRRIVAALLKRRASLGRGVRDVVLSAVKAVSVTWFTVAGAYFAMLSLPVAPQAERILEKLLTAVVILAGALAAAKVGGGFVNLYAARRQRLPGATSLFVNMARVFVIAIGVLVALQSLGVSIGPVLGALGVGGLAVALALEETLSNLFGGLHVLSSKKVLPGDYIKLDSGEEGTVIDVNWRSTALRDIYNSVVLVPNAKLAEAIITNYHQPASEMSMVIPVGVDYGSDLRKVERVTCEVAAEVMQEVDGGVPAFTPFIWYHTFDDFSIGFDVFLRVQEHPKQYEVRHQFMKRLHRRYREEGIEIPFPIEWAIEKNGRGPESDGPGPRRKDSVPATGQPG